jgi:tRNA G10  N-methylase Trm11
VTDKLFCDIVIEMKENENKKFAFVLGRERDLCLFELKAILSLFGFDFGIISLTDNVVFINTTATSEEMAHLASILGGTVKIFEIISDADDIKSEMVQFIENNLAESGKITFGLSVYDPERLNFTLRMANNIGFQVKKEIKKSNISSRFIELKDGLEVQNIISLKEKLVDKGVEFGLFTIGLGVMIGMSNPLEWSRRDYDKPAGDKYSGMLPPKLARMMINIALSQNNDELNNTVLLDPFCGSGNIILESIVLGLESFGSDNSEKAVKDTKSNCEWLRRDLNREINYEIEVGDATSFDFGKILNNEKRVIVVTEPYLGEPKKFKPTLNAARGEYRKVKELYMSFLDNLKKSKKDDKKVVICMVFPIVETVEGERYSLYQESVDEMVKIGYSVLVKPLIYGRDYQVVKRQIAVLSL